MVRTFAAADIGSNTAHLLVAATDGHFVMRIANTNEWIPLGEVVARQGAIPGEIVEALVQAMRSFRRVAEKERAEDMYIFGTEALRTASNSEEVLATIYAATGVRVDLISPAREAELSFRGIGLDTRHMGAGLLVEVGGGSAQIARMNGDRLGPRVSRPIGTGRVIAEANLANPASPESVLNAREYVRRHLGDGQVTSRNALAVLSGGVARGLWRALHPDGDKRMFPWEIDFIARAAERLTVDRIVSRFGVKPKRAATLLPGALIYSEILQSFQIEEVIISEFGVREGAILEMAAASLKLESAPIIT
ncbi:MAG: hypothetical protein C4320_00725 [Armatimonadota bacterium]